jgi:hypothetical protein
MPDPVTDIESFKAFIRARTKETWDQRRIPYYLSFVAIDLKKLGVSYRALLGPLKLSQWASLNEVPETALVAHPTHRAKIGFVPANSGFAFDMEEPLPRPARGLDSHSARSRALVQFVQSLVDLPESAIEGFQVPAKTLIGFLKH